MSQKPQDRTNSRDYFIVVAGLIVTLVIFVVSYVFTWASPPSSNSTVINQGQSLENRIEILSKSLQEASNNISDIENEIQARQDLVKQLEEQQKTVEQLVTLNKDQVDAVAQTLRGEIEESNRWKFWIDFGQKFGIAAFFFIVGLVVQRWNGTRTRNRRQ